MVLAPFCGGIRLTVTSSYTKCSCDRGCRGRAPPGIATCGSAAAMVASPHSGWRYIAYARYPCGHFSDIPRGNTCGDIRKMFIFRSGHTLWQYLKLWMGDGCDDNDDTYPPGGVSSQPSLSSLTGIASSFSDFSAASFSASIFSST